MTLPALLALLDSQKLFFRRASKFEDRFEGAIPRPAEEALKIWEKQVWKAEAKPHDRTERAKTRDIVVINCWHMSTHESSAMWSQYGKNEESVAIRSTCQQLINALPQVQDGEDDPGWGQIFVGTVKYIDYATATFPAHNIYYPFVHKREAFKHENEVRAMTMISQAAQAAADSGQARDFEVTTTGLHLPVDVATLIDSICISPLAGAWFERIARASVERFGFSIPVRKSAMAEDPIY
jgi:hypothetical protein